MFTIDFPFVRCALLIYQRKAHDRRKDTAFEVSAFLRLTIQPSRMSIPRAYRQIRQKERRQSSLVGRIDTKTTAKQQRPS
ncbi:MULTISPECIES: hypothetical protein [Paraburkholderia]|uniref:hypothetical protein n=1 Tax=Paraburkholderia TaxID=1822464 RepID=UPI0013A6BB82|nr:MULTISPECIES: hypothetical protein [Paraburkholderia]MDH6152481.1 hypothetical protein [Paraburkholderia sp. WSM4179]